MPEIAMPTARMSASDRRAQLLNVALNLFSEKGFDGVTTKEIASAAGVTEAVIFRHFPTKQALYQGVLEAELGGQDLRKWLAESQACMDRNDDAGLFRIIASAVIEGYRSDPRMERVMLFAALQGNAQALEHYRNFCLPIYDLLRDYILRRQREGALADYEPGAILSAIAGMAQRYAMSTGMFGFRAESSDPEVVELFTRILMNGVQTR
jgi:TetR/AcrR family transcriptional regulator